MQTLRTVHLSPAVGGPATPFKRWSWLAVALLAWLLVVAGPPAHANQRIALVIGNGAYQHDKVLPNPRNDADGLAAVLRRLGFEVTQGKDLGKSAMERTVLEFGRKASGAEIALVYYAGHGLEVGGKNYLLPVDARLPDELALRTEALDMELILEAVAPARTRLLFMDACRNNPLANNMRIRTAGRSVGRGLGRVDAVSNTLIAFATAPGTVAADGEGRNSPFAAALMTHLEQPGLEIQQVMREVRRSVAQATRNQQIPWDSSQLFDAVVLKPGAAVQVASVAPEMVRIPAGSFMMGSPAGEAGRDGDEGPQRRVNVKAFELGKTEVTRGQYAAFVRATGHPDGDGCYVLAGGKWEKQTDKSWRNPGFEQSDDHPVACVSWSDAQAYASWLSRSTGKAYRLPSEAEWEYAARAGCEAAFNVGGQCAHKIEASEANFNGNHSYNGSSKGVYRQKTTAVGSFKANNWGLSDMHGNVWEWVQDCHEGNYSQGQPVDGSAHRATDSACSHRVLRSGSWGDYPQNLRAAFRGRDSPANRVSNGGFRLARTVP